MIENILSIFIRNDGNPTLAMMGLIITSVVNIVLNYLFIFVFEFGLKGVAYAIVISGVAGIFVLLTHFLSVKKQLGITKSFIKELNLAGILAIGFPSFLVEASAALVVILFNVTFNKFMGDIGLASYAVVNYLHIVFLMLFIGVGAALQPITSYLYGAIQYGKMAIFLKLALISAGGLGIFLTIFGIVGDLFLIKVFGITDPEIVEYTAIGIQSFFLGYLFLGINMVLLEFYQSIARVRYAVMIVVLRVVIFFIPLIFLLPAFWGANSIWLAFPLSEAGAVIVVLLAVKLRWIRLIPKEKIAAKAIGSQTLG